ncbi:molecular chaperone DnaJ [Mesomycoplasma conjunctivae]|uniref:molecular chaperone DnaJ n=1 Tax=Mesomycoplasma conjunctivae TaxID=45361 RepID=UPI003DA582BB
MTKKDYYEVLCISRSADTSEIKKAYRTLANKWHPDKHSQKTEAEKKEAEEKFKEVLEAYEVLSDENKKSQYDTYGHAAFEQGGMGGAQGFSGFSGFGDIFSDLFEGFGFGGRSSRNSNQAQRGQDLIRSINISFEDSILGTKTKINLDKYNNCSHCNGSGANSSQDIHVCSTCNGKGQVIELTRVPGFGQIQNTTTCRKCAGSGKIISKKCKQCLGSTYTKINETITINIPAGIRDGMQIRMSGYGGPGKNRGSNGDLLLEINVLSHKHYTRAGSDIHINLPVSIVDIINENYVDVPAPIGMQQIRLRQHYKSGDVITVKNAGAPIKPNSSSKGDLKVHLVFYIPDFSTKQKHKLNEVFDELKDKTKDKWLKDFY